MKYRSGLTPEQLAIWAKGTYEREHRTEPLPYPGETVLEARERRHWLYQYNANLEWGLPSQQARPTGVVSRAEYLAAIGGEST